MFAFLKHLIAGGPEAIIYHTKIAFRNGERLYGGDQKDAVAHTVKTFGSLYGTAIDKRPTMPKFKGHLSDMGIYAESVPFAYAESKTGAQDGIAQYLAWVLHGQSNFVNSDFLESVIEEGLEIYTEEEGREALEEVIEMLPAWIPFAPKALKKLKRNG